MGTIEILCVNCKVPIEHYNGKWVHAIEAAMWWSDWGTVGCRAASFNEGTGWNETLDRRAKARPSPEDRKYLKAIGAL